MEINKREEFLKEILHKLRFGIKKAGFTQEKIAEHNGLKFKTLENILQFSVFPKIFVSGLRLHEREHCVDVIFQTIPIDKIDSRTKKLLSLIQTKKIPLRQFAFGRFAEDFYIFLGILLEVIEDDLDNYEIQAIAGILRVSVDEFNNFNR